MFKKKSILFIVPDYHCSFVLRDEFRRLGWRANVYIPPGYPEKLLYKNEGLSMVKFSRFGNKQIRRIVTALVRGYYLLIALSFYKYYVFYGTMEAFPSILDKVVSRFLGEGSRLWLSVGKVLGKKMVYIPSGCLDEELQSNVAKVDNGNVCNNCGVPVCEDTLQIPRFRVYRRYGDLFFDDSGFKSSQFPLTQMRYKSLDLDAWRPDIEVAEEFLLPRTDRIRILHSFYPGGRTAGERNIKGSPFVLAAIERLKSEGYAVEYYYLQDVPSRHMRYYQVQADIVVDQLIYGWWGSTGIEGMALGKPVVCYLRKELKERFLKRYPEYDFLPILEANTENIYDVLKKLLDSKELLKHSGRESRIFAERHYDGKKNAFDLQKLFLSL